MPLQPHPLPSSSSRWPRSGTRPATDARDRARPCLVEVAGPVVGDDGGDLHVGTSVAQHQQVCCKRHRARVENPMRAEVRCSSSTHTRGLVPPSSLAEFLRGGLRVEALAVRRRWVLRLLLGQPAGATSACAAWLDRGQRASQHGNGRPRSAYRVGHPRWRGRSHTRKEPAGVQYRCCS